MDVRIAEYIRAGLERGYTSESLRQALLNQGWDPSEVEQAFQQLKGSPEPPPLPQEAHATVPAKPKKPLGRVTILIILLAAVVLLIMFLAFFTGVFSSIGLFSSKRCTGFGYFTYMEQNASSVSFTLQLKNGAQNVTISSMKVGDATDYSPLVQGISSGIVKQGSIFATRAAGITLPKGKYNNLTITITYDVLGGASGSKDTAVCAGEVA